MGKTIATCGHEVDQGINCSIDEFDFVSYGTYCDKCLKIYHNEGRILNRELNRLFDELERLERENERLKGK